MGGADGGKGGEVRGGDVGGGGGAGQPRLVIKVPDSVVDGAAKPAQHGASHQQRVPPAEIKNNYFEYQSHY